MTENATTAIDDEVIVGNGLEVNEQPEEDTVEYELEIPDEQLEEWEEEAEELGMDVEEYVSMKLQSEF